MQQLLQQLQQLQEQPVAKRITNRLQEFQDLKQKGNNEWFSELCFCILTANAKSATACAIQKELGYEGFANKTQGQLVETIKRNKHRFHNTKAQRIIGVRVYKNTIKNILLEKESETEMRNWLQQNIKGYGFKEASHFLRNVGFTNLAILDRHILNILVEHNLLKEKPKTLNKKRYEEIEQIMFQIGHAAKMNQAELDMYLWYMKAKDVLK